jgi:hypothetical protein
MPLKLIIASLFLIILSACSYNRPNLRDCSERRTPPAAANLEIERAAERVFAGHKLGACIEIGRGTGPNRQKSILPFLCWS